MPLSRRFNRPPADFHQDFGYLSPSGRRRNTVRVALAAATFGLVIGVVGAMVLLPRIGRDVRIEQALAAVQAVHSDTTTDGLPVALPPAEPTRATDGIAPGQSLPAAASGRKVVAPKASQAASPAPASPSAASPAAAAPATVAPAVARAAPAATDADKPCKEETWPYFDSKCLWGGPRKDVAAAPAETRAAQPAPAEAAPAADPPEQRAVAKKKPKPTNTSARRRSREEAEPRTAYVNPNGSPYGGPFGRPYNPYGGPWRSGGYEPRREWGGFGW